MRKIALFGLGEAGSLFASDLAAQGVEVNAYDPENVETPKNVRRMDTPQQAVQDVQMVFAMTAGTDAIGALEQAIEDIPVAAIYADFSTNSSAVKRCLAEKAANYSLAFVDVALMSVVPGKGLYAPTLVSGTGAKRFHQLLSVFGVPIEIVGDCAGDAASRKLLRSVMMKGLAAVIIESMRAGEAAGCEQWLWNNLSAELAKADEALVARLVSGTQTHVVRRLHEMECTEQLLLELGVEPLMTRSTVESLRMVMKKGLPKLLEH